MDSEAKIEGLRAQITELQRSVEELKNATLPAAEVKAAVKDFLDSEAEKKSLAEYEELVNPGGPTVFFDLDPERILLHLFRDEVEQRLIQHLEAQNPNPGLTRAAREKKTANLAAQIDGLAREEELAILQAEDSGEIIERRKDADGALIADLWHEVLSDDGRLRSAA